jgi:hypothetical protein
MSAEALTRRQGKTHAALPNSKPVARLAHALLTRRRHAGPA